MPDLRIATMDGRETVLAGASVDDFKARLLGSVLRMEDAGYAEARSLWNAMIDRRPALIARCAGTADVTPRRPQNIWDTR